MDELLKELEQFKDLTSAFTLLDISLVLFLSFVLSLFVAWIYRYTHRGVSYSQSFVHTLIIMGTVVALIMLIIGSNIARAFALVGALSVIRFRNAVKESRDVGFVFLVMAIGMACGTRFYMLAAFATVTLGTFMVILYKLDLFKKDVRERILKVRLPIDRDYETLFAELFDNLLVESNIISVETVRAGVLQEIVFSVVLKKDVHPKQLLEEIRQLNDNNKVMLLLGQQEIDL